MGRTEGFQSVCDHDTVEIPGTPSFSSFFFSFFRDGKDRGIFSLCVGHSRNPRDYRFVLGRKDRGILVCV